MRQKKGFTLVELMFALAILIPVALIAVNVNSLMAGRVRTARLITIALHDANTVMERIRDTSDLGLSQIVSSYPSGQAVSGFANLPNEAVVVQYPDPNANPLAITVSVEWTDSGRLMRRVLTSYVTTR